LAKAIALETYTKEVLISDLWLKTSRLMTFEFCFIVLGQIPGHYLKPQNCIILRHWQRCWLNQRRNHSMIYNLQLQNLESSTGFYCTW